MKKERVTKTDRKLKNYWIFQNNNSQITFTVVTKSGDV